MGSAHLVSAQEHGDKTIRRNAAPPKHTRIGKSGRYARQHRRIVNNLAADLANYLAEFGVCITGRTFAAEDGLELDQGIVNRGAKLLDESLVLVSGNQAA